MRITSSAVAAVSAVACYSSGVMALNTAVKRVARTSSTARRIPLAMVSTTMTGAASDAKATEANNPLMDQGGLPKFSKIEPYHLSPAVSALLAQLETDFENLEAKLTSETTYDDVVPVVERIQDPLGYAWGVAGHLNGVKNGEELRKAYEENQPGVVKAMTKFSQSRPLYDALEGIQKSWDTETALDFEESQKMRAVSNTVRGMKLGGVGLEGEVKEKFNEMKMKLAELSTKFSNNVLDETKAFSLTIDDVKEVERVPPSALAMWSQSHAMHKATRAGEENENASETKKIDPAAGPWRITLDGPSYIAAMSHLPSRSLREKVYRAYLTRASDFSSDESKSNVPLIHEILSLKHEMATMLGYDNYAEQSLEAKMAPDVSSVAELSDFIREKALPAAERELGEITALARAKGGEEYAESNMEKLQPWDVTYWSERLKESKFDLTEEQLRPYFALPAVLDGMFGLVKRIFNIEVRMADGDVEVWHPDVRFFNVYDVESNEHIASFYLDPYSRPENKRGGAWMDVCIGKSDACDRKVPVAYLTCNGSPPVGETPSLMTFREVETLFHEFGHGLQHMLTRAAVGDVAGINGVEWDAVELPSQFMENWCYDRPTVYGFANHYETGEPLPDDMFNKLKEQKTYGAGMMACRQLYFGMLDMELHSSFDPKKATEKDGETIFDVQKRMAAKYVPYSMPLEEDRFLCTFGHIFGGGYAAGYYSYKWAEVMSADAFGAFEDVGLDKEDEVKKVGKRFRDTVLSLGGGVEPMEVFTRFRGREPNPEALLRHNGLV